MPLAGFEPAIPASDRPQTLTLDRSATGIGQWFNPQTVQPAASRYTDWAIPAHHRERIAVEIYVTLNILTQELYLLYEIL